MTLYATDENLAQALLETGFATHQQVDKLFEVQAAQASCGRSVSISDLALQFNLVTRQQLHEISKQARPIEVSVQAAPTIGPFEILEELGEGAAGKVYKARRPGTSALVALKVIPSPNAPEAQHLFQRFERETELAKALCHPNIVKVHEAGYDGQRLYYAMDFVWGRPMADYAPEGRPAIDLPFSLGLLRQVVDAVAYAHEQGVIHRDLKLSNVLVGEGGKAYLSDFGLAKSSHSSTMTRLGDIIGTPYYMSPELASGAGAQADHRTDIWALGVMLYRIAVGRYPFVGTSAAEIMLAVLESDLEFPTDVEVHPNIINMCRKALARPLKDRYASAGDLAADIDRHLRGERVAPPKRSSGVILGILICAVIALLALSAAGVYLLIFR